MLRQISDRDHILQRPSMYIGGVDLTTTQDYLTNGEKIEYREISYTPGLIKIINEIIDNSLDVAIKTNFKSSTEISVKMTKDYVEVQDNGTGIPVIQNEVGAYIPRIAWGAARAGSNFDDDENRAHIGMNGVGSFATNCYSKKFIGTSDDGNKQYQVTFTNNAEKFTEKLSATTKKTGVNVKFWPDLQRFSLEEIDETHMNVIKQRLINLSMSYPKITFKFNGRKINVGSFKKYISLFSDIAEIYETEDYKFAFIHNQDDDFRQFSYVNGLNISDGGTHIDVLSYQVISRIRDKLVKKYKTIKPGDIKNKLMIVCFMKNMKNTKFSSQSKEKITNSVADINAYLGNIDYDQFAAKVLRNKGIIEPITEVYRIKEEFKKRQELKGLKKTTKKVKSDKYIPSIGVKKYLLITEGQSATGGLMPALGRKECGYYELKGKPLNAYSADHKKFMQNKELAGDAKSPGLLQIIQNEEYEYIVYATDQDLDGYHIRGLLNGFFQRYAPEWKNRIGMLQTPVIAVTKNNKLVDWHYNLSDNIKLKSGESSEYKKGLGSWNSDDLKIVVKADGVEEMIKIIDFDSDEIIEEWLGKDSEPRKKYLIQNNFSIAKL